MSRSGNLLVDQLRNKYDKIEETKSEWLDRVAELVKSNKISKEEVFSLLEYVVEKGEN